MKLIDQRLQRIKALMRGKADAFLITSQNNRYYASNFFSSAGYVILTENKVFLMLDSRYSEAAKHTQLLGFLPSDAEIIKVRTTYTETLRELFDGLRPKAILYENRTLTCFGLEQLKREFKDKTFLPSNRLLEDCRAGKDPDEIARIHRAQEITDQTFSHILGYIKPGVTERDLALEIEWEMRKNGAQKPAFDIICVSGKKSALPHGVPDEIKLSPGFLTMDFGARYEGYCSDMTRTVSIGRPTEKMKKVYDTVRRAQDAAFDQITAGVEGSKVDRAAREVIEAEGFGSFFEHGTGHSLGLDIHESPNFSQNETGTVPENAVISVEPGIYLPGMFGVRIEDIVLVKKNSYENLTKSAKELIII